MNLGLFSYLGAAVAYGFFTILLLFSWRGSLQGKLLIGVVFTSAVWAVVATTVAINNNALFSAYRTLEILRYAVWYVFLLKLFDNAPTKDKGYHRFVRLVLPASVGFAVLLWIYEISASVVQSAFSITGHVLLALAGLAIIEQLFRNASLQHRWAIKYLFIGAGGIFAYDFYLYADALLFRVIDPHLWEARGIINLVSVPLLTIAAARNKDWSLNIFVSRDIVLNTTAILGGGLYLLVMAGAGYYFREYGGNWGHIGQIVFFSLAVLLLVAILFSVNLRARVRVFLGKHFYKNKYDYRVEWLRLTGELSENNQGEARFQAVIEALAHIVDARAGLLWLRDDQWTYRNVASWQLRLLDMTEPGDSSLISYLEKGYIVNVTELDSCADEYEGLVLSAWIDSVYSPWLIIPLPGLDALIGFVVLANPLVARSINWEDRDLLITAAKQVSSHVTVLMTSDALAEAKQFEVFTRLSAFMVHDLKNIAAELELVARNAKKHMSNPAFVEDAFETVENASADIKRLLDQLRNRRVRSEKKTTFDVGVLLKAMVESKQERLPSPSLERFCAGCYVVAEKDRLSNVIAHLIENAQQATCDDGQVLVSLDREGETCVIEIRDSGHGMDADFIRNRLFKAFDTTKGNAGMGIGMYESRDFIRQLHGDIQVQSEPGEGTTVSLYIPASSAPDSGDNQ